MTIHNETHYAAGCRTDECRAAHAAGARRRRRAKAYGTHVPKSVPIVGVTRRIQALACLGWSKRELSRRIGWQHDRLSVMLTEQGGVSPRNLGRITALYDELWNTPAPTGTKGERISANRTLIAADRLGYLPPMAWDDETIDDPSAPTPRTTRGAWDLKPCGTAAAARRHHRNGEALDDACRNAERRQWAERRTA